MRKSLFLFATLALLGFSACSDDDDKVSLPDITVNFASTEVGLSDDNIAEVSVILSRNTDVNLDVTVDLATVEGAVYDTDFTTNPASTANTITITIPAGSSTASIVVEKNSASSVDGADYVTFKLSPSFATTGFVLGDKTSSTVYFGPLFSKGDQMTLNGRVGDDTYHNSVYVDFSRNSQVAVDRKSWNLGFYNGAEYRVYLNAAYATTAISTGKTDINAVTLADAEASYDIGGNFYMTAAGLRGDIVDSFDGVLTGTAFAEISANENENMVYFVAPADSKSSRDLWYKVKVNRSANGGYSVQYTTVGGTEIKTVEIAKNSAYNLSFLSFESATTTSVEPEAKKWDILWSYYTANRFNSTGYDGTAYFLQDAIVLNNLGGVEAAEVFTSTVSYDNIKKGDLASLTFASDRMTIGDTWRSTSNFGGGTLGIYTDRFYVVKDADGNNYKLRFLKMGLNNDGGERGRPVIEYALIEE